MVDNNKDTTVEVVADEVVTVDVTDNPDLQGTPDPAAAAAPATSAPAEVVPATTPQVSPEAPATTPASAADQAAESITNQLRQAEEARRAAEATALAERQRREQAEAAQARQFQEAQQAREAADQHRLTIINNGFENAQRELESAKGELQRAYESGEFAKAADAQVRISKAAADLARFEDAKVAFEQDSARRAQAAPTTEGRVEQQPPQGNIFEQFVTRFPPAAQAWLRAHPECAPPEVGGEPRANARMLAGHYDAVAKGLTPNTPEYFRTLEEHTGHRQPAQPTAAAPESAAAVVQPAARQRTPAPKAPLAAPPSREAPTGSNVPRSTRQVTLTKEQQEAAKISFPHLDTRQAFAAYARNLVELEAEGKMGRLTH